MDAKQRFEVKIELVPFVSCWLWTGALYPNGYGAVAGREQLAHRAAWRFEFGEIPPGMQVLHRCDVTFCVNPSHLFLGTHQDNMRDKALKGRAHGPLEPHIDRFIPAYKRRTKAKRSEEQVRRREQRRAWWLSRAPTSQRSS